MENVTKKQQCNNIGFYYGTAKKKCIERHCFQKSQYTVYMAFACYFQSRFALYLEHVPAGTSLKTFVYYAQVSDTSAIGTKIIPE